MTAAVTPDVARIVDQVRAARASRTALRLRGRGTWLDAGRPCSATEQLDLGALSGIVAYEPGDLTLTARAGTSLAEIARVTAAKGQWLTLDPYGSPDGTLGATMATASAGPLASAFGTPRDHVLGCEYVTGAGDVVRAGGRVVKNVAGFDLTRLVTGAWGTLGAITEVTVRLRARPAFDRTFAVSVDDAEAAWRWLRTTENTPLAAELVSATLAARLGVGSTALLVRLGGNETFMQSAEGDCATLGSMTPMDISVWGTLATAEAPEAIALRFSTRPSRIAPVWEAAARFAEEAGGFAHATIGRGIVRCVLPATANSTATLDAFTVPATVVGERLPRALWDTVARTRPTDALAASARRAFDPDGILNPGILGDT